MRAPPNDLSSPVKAIEILDQVGVELSFVEPDKDTGLLPINSFVMDLEELAEFPPTMAAAIADARRWLDETLDGSGKCTREFIHNFTAWHAWMMAAVKAWQRGADGPAVPTSWAQPGKPELAASAANPGFACAPGPTVPPAQEEPAIRLQLEEDAELLREFHSES